MISGTPEFDEAMVSLIERLTKAGWVSQSRLDIGRGDNLAIDWTECGKHGLQGLSIYFDDLGYPIPHNEMVCLHFLIDYFARRSGQSGSDVFPDDRPTA